MSEKEISCQQQIVYILIKAGTPISLNDISKKSDHTPQLINYHLKQLIKDGIILKENTSSTPKYGLQKIFYNEGIRDHMQYTILGLVLQTKDEINDNYVDSLDVLYFLLNYIKYSL